MIRTIDELSPHWQTFWTVEVGADPNCKHAYEEFEFVHEDETSALYLCLHCGCKLEYDVADIGD